MMYRLACDTCEFGEQTDAAPNAYVSARDHEADHPSHYVDITER